MKKAMISAKLLSRGRVQCTISNIDYRRVEAARKLLRDFDWQITEAKLKLVGVSGGGQSMKVHRSNGTTKITFGYPLANDICD